jgi:hypothetical protein
LKRVKYSNGGHNKQKNFGSISAMTSGGRLNWSAQTPGNVSIGASGTDTKVREAGVKVKQQVNKSTSISGSAMFPTGRGGKPRYFLTIKRSF